MPVSEVKPTLEHGPAPEDAPRGWLHRNWRRLVKELIFVAIFAVMYEELREHIVQDGSVATRHALSVVSVERALGIFHEQALQAVFIKIDPLMDTFNVYYGATHFLVPAGILIWLVLRHPARYARARTTLVVITALAFGVFWLFPVAPPRLLPSRFGIVDTLVSVKSGHIESTLINSVGDKYASMPSLHVAWAVWCALALYPVVRHVILRVITVAYPVATTLVVVATGNHFFLDALAGTALAVAAWMAVTHLPRWIEGWRAPG